MIVELNVDNIALIERAQLVLGPGFTALTGETGAGKSLLIDSIELALGARADTELIRTGALRAQVNLTFDLSLRANLEAQIEALGCLVEDHLLYIQRDLYSEGRSQARIGGRAVPIHVLKAVGRLLVDLHGQHEHQSLLSPETHIAFLDDWIGEDARVALEKVAKDFAVHGEAARRLANIRKSQREREQRLDMLRYQAEEIGALAPRIGEMDELLASESRLRNADRIRCSLLAALELLSDGEPSATGFTASAQANLNEISRLDPGFVELANVFESARVSLEEAVRDLRPYLEQIEADPELHEQVLERIEGYRKLFRKYGDDEAALLEQQEQISQELALLESDSESEDALAVLEAESLAILRASCEHLTNLRAQHAAEFSRAVEKQLSGLAMEAAQFSVSITSIEPSSTGADAVEFLFSANAGEPPKPLAKIASGGEISRAMLAIKSILAANAGVATMIFDEVDVGLGGKAAARVANLLDQLSLHSQVIVISHLPQIASRAASHFAIHKRPSGGRVVTEIGPLSREERIEELARMIDGESITDSARDHARQMLA